MSNWKKIGPVDELKEPVKLIMEDQQRIALFKLDDGFYAIDDVCSHAEGSLSRGVVDGHEVQCPEHGARFDIKTGKNLSFPAVVPVSSFPVKVEDGVVYVDLDN